MKILAHGSIAKTFINSFQRRADVIQKYTEVAGHESGQAMDNAKSSSEMQPTILYMPDLPCTPKGAHCKVFGQVGQCSHKPFSRA